MSEESLMLSRITYRVGREAVQEYRSGDVESVPEGLAVLGNTA